ncbi:MAG: hypothetical protein OXH99_14335 [Bryobacterales bacterium]|nr:hypothetical protein [Bryobacterales bacterium]
MGKYRYKLVDPKSVTNEELKRIAWDFAREGGNLARLPKILGLSDERWKGFFDWLDARAEPRYPDERFPILIPETSPTSYISFNRALNLHAPGELTGDWHFDVSFFGYPERSCAPLAGRHSLVNTTPALGSRGVRDMGRLIADYGIKPYDGPVWVANHYRAIADIAMGQLQQYCSSEVVPAPQIDDWLWSEEDFDILVEDYLKPLRAQIRGRRRKAYDEWLPTVVYGAE